MSSAPMTTVPEELIDAALVSELRLHIGKWIMHDDRLTSNQRLLKRALRAIEAKARGAAISPPLGAGHPDDTAVDRFSDAMKRKLEQKRQEGRGGWEDKAQCTAEFLSQLLREHVDKGDPVDVANLAMMLHQRGERIV